MTVAWPINCYNIIIIILSLFLCHASHWGSYGSLGTAQGMAQPLPILMIVILPHLQQIFEGEERRDWVGWWWRGVLNFADLINLLAVEVRESDVFDESFVHQLLHGSPCVNEGGVPIVHRSIGVLGHLDVARLEGYWPVHQVKVNIA